MRYKMIALLAFTLAAGNASAGEREVRSTLAKQLPGSQITYLKPSAIKGLWEYRTDLSIGYVSDNGTHLMFGDIVDSRTGMNITNQARSAIKAAKLNAIPVNSRIRFSPPKGTPNIGSVFVFTDITCGYCQKLHSQISEYTKLGITVDYLAYPREGVSSETGRKMKDVWCSTSKQTALTAAKSGRPVKQANCNSPISAEYALGKQFQIQGTPAIFDIHGNELGGYLPPQDLKMMMHAAKPVKM